MWRRHLNIYPDRNQFTYHRSGRPIRVSPLDKHAVTVQERLQRRPNLIHVGAEVVDEGYSERPTEEIAMRHVKCRSPQ